jgi:ubiquinone/menaquinone biosynthesis C-methylase UbiE
MSGGPFSPEREWHLLFGELPFGGASVYLDNATATGYLGRALARSLVTTQAPYVVIANDLSIPMLRRAAELARRDGVAERMFFIHADSGSLPLRSGSVDGVLCGGTLNEFTESQRVLQEWARVLSPRGVVSVMLQTLASGWRGSLQRSLARLLGLTIEPADRARERFEAVFHGLRELSFGPVLFMSGQRRASTQNNYPSQAA